MRPTAARASISASGGRLAPLLERDRRRIELMNSLLLSMPGTPVIYYGDEIGMGDNIHLGDRDGVRTPMQWSPDRNGGFSRADPAALVLPPIMDPLYGYGSVNVEAQSRDPHSLLNWMRRMLTVRNRHPAFGRGQLTLLYPKIARSWPICASIKTILCCASSTSPTVRKRSSSTCRNSQGAIPIELNAGSVFPPIGELTYLLTLPPYGFYWFALATQKDQPTWHTPAPEPLPEFVTMVTRDPLARALVTPAAKLIEDDALPQYIVKRRWFGFKDHDIESARIANVADFSEAAREMVLCEIEVRTDVGATRWLVPLGIQWEDEQATALPSRLALARVRRGRQLGVLTDAFVLPEFARQVIEAMGEEKAVPSDDGVIHFRPTEASPPLRRQLPPMADVQWLAAEQSNSSLTVGDAAMLKIYRRISPGHHPEAEMNRYLDDPWIHPCAIAAGRCGPRRRRRHAVDIGRFAAVCTQRRRCLELDPRPSDAGRSMRTRRR